MSDSAQQSENLHLDLRETHFLMLGHMGGLNMTLKSLKEVVKKSDYDKKTKETAQSGMNG